MSVIYIMHQCTIASWMMLLFPRGFVNIFVYGSDSWKPTVSSTAKHLAVLAYEDFFFVLCCNNQNIFKPGNPMLLSQFLNIVQEGESSIILSARSSFLTNITICPREFKWHLTTTFGFMVEQQGKSKVILNETLFYSFIKVETWEGIWNGL